MGWRRPILLPFRDRVDWCSTGTDDAEWVVEPADGETCRCCRRSDVDACCQGCFPFSKWTLSSRRYIHWVSCRATLHTSTIDCSLWRLSRCLTWVEQWADDPAYLATECAASAVC